jgi:isopentenyl diphosphate isomerase/L-lactate dehydrogenase-like FMN-dependent dehydrogenase
MRLSDAQNVRDLRTLAKRRLPSVVFDYIDGGVEDEKGLAHNRRAFDNIRIVPRYLVDISTRKLGTSFFGRDYDLPFGIAPTGLNNFAWPGADMALARTAANANIPFVLSTASTTSIEKIAAAIPEHAWFQLYVPRDQPVREDLLKRVAAAGVEGLMVTVDIPLPAKRERDNRNRFTLPLRPSLPVIANAMTHLGWGMQILRHGSPRFENLAPYTDPGAGAQSLATYVMEQLAPALSWETFDWVREAWKDKPLLIKGIMSAEDAELAHAHGADGIVLSNHGGRQLDSAPSPIEVLPEISEAIGDRLVIALDSGVRRGADIVKALALGADFVFVGRATLYGVAAAGQKGAEAALGFLRDEFDRCMGQIGRTAIDQLNEAELWVDVPHPVP